MAFSVNRVTLVGNITQPPQISYSAKGTAILKLNVATNWRRKNETTGEWEDEPSFHRVTVFGNQAEYLGSNANKGDKVYLDGRIQYGSYEKDGVTRYTTDIIANTVIPMSNKGGNTSPTAYPTARPQSAPTSQAAPVPASLTQEDTAESELASVNNADTAAGNLEVSSSGAASVPTTTPNEKVAIEDIPF